MSHSELGRAVALKDWATSTFAAPRRSAQPSDESWKSREFPIAQRLSQKGTRRI